MQYLTGKSIRPQVGGFYLLRAGLRCFIYDSYDLYGVTFFRGHILDQVPVVVFWYAHGGYAPGGVAHELDIMKLSD